MFPYFRLSGPINIYGLGLTYSSETSSSAICNLLPAVAFIIPCNNIGILDPQYTVWRILILD
jgi:hypothetical protein